LNVCSRLFKVTEGQRSKMIGNKEKEKV